MMLAGRACYCVRVILSACGLTHSSMSVVYFTRFPYDMRFLENVERKREKEKAREFVIYTYMLSFKLY